MVKEISTKIDISQLGWKLFYIVGLYVSFVISGIFEEKLYKGTYVDDKNNKFRFDHPMLALFLNGLISYLFAEYFLWGKTYKHSLLDKKDKFILGVYNLISRICAERSLKYVDFIMKIIGKSCKSGAIILTYYLYSLPFLGDIFKKLINIQDQGKKEHPELKEDLIKVCLTTASIILFNLEDSNEKSSTTHIDIKLLLIGYGLLILSLLCDGIVGLKEKIIGHKVHHDPEYFDYNGYLGWEYNKLFSFFFIIFSSFAILSNIIFFGGMDAISIYFKNRELMLNLISYAICTSIGQIFIYILLEKYGPLTLSMVTGIRKILSIAISIVLFGKVISLWKFMSLMLGTLVIVWEIYDKVKRHDKKPHTGHVDADPNLKKE